MTSPTSPVSASSATASGAVSGTTAAATSGAHPPLTRRDILAFENMLRDDVARVLPFTAHALYFPTADEVPAPVWIAEEQKLLLPLRRGEALLGVLLLRGPDPAAVEALLPHLPGIADLCLDKLALYKSGRTDSLTGLAARPVLLERLAGEMADVRRAFAVGMGMDPGDDEKHIGATTDRAPSPHAAFGVVALRLSGLRAASRAHGHGTAERLMRALGAALRDALPEEALAARTGDSEFAVMLPGAARPDTEEAARAFVRALDAVHLQSPLTGSSVQASAHAGYALFPQDWEADREGRESPENDAESYGEAESLFEKARLAAYRATPGQDGGVLGYGAILPRGGVVERVLPLSRVTVSLGRDVGAAEGQRFSVWSLNYPVQSLDGRKGAPGNPDPLEPLYKGEVVLVDVREDAAQAEILLLGDPAWPLEPGDRLVLLPGDYGSTAAEGSGKPDPLTGLYRHGDFLARLALARERHARFGLALFRLSSLHAGHAGDSASLPDYGPDYRADNMEHLLGEAFAEARRLLDGRANDFMPTSEMISGASPDNLAAALPVDGELLAGRYSLNSFLIFHPGLAPDEAREIYPPLAAELSRRLGRSVAVGVACVPWLAYRAADALDCCRKALDYALLLPEPHAGVFDSLAINISADRRYSQGDVFGAMEEYRLALLADENNTLAWNSLGVCLAGMGKPDEARRAFEEAVRRSPGDPAGHYNLGTVCVTLGDAENAVAQFDACLERDAGHLFARVRLGELAEARGDKNEARAQYEAALASDPASPLPHRCMARLELREGRPGEARERLHQALSRDPRDPFSLHLLARLYLDGGEDPEMAESLARQSLILRPGHKASWLELARALELQGRHRDARDARAKAGAL